MRILKSCLKAIAEWWHDHELLFFEWVLIPVFFISLLAAIFFSWIWPWLGPILGK